MIDKHIQKIEKQILVEKYKTALKKAQFVNEIKNGLGSEIKKNPNKAIIKKKNWVTKFILLLKKIFTKF